VATDDERPGYLGAMLDAEHRLVLIPLDPEEPWTAFRRMRTWMKRSRKGPAWTSVGVFTAPPEVAATNVVTLRPRARDAR
jgi:hypothetical protein